MIDPLTVRLLLRLPGVSLHGEEAGLPDLLAVPARLVYREVTGQKAAIPLDQQHV